jgi:D-glycero-alpha-D-manno-heptose-7-phosphate kinase
MLSGRQAIITGANRGLGLEIARRFVAMGAGDAALLQIEAQALAALYSGRRIVWRSLDVASEADSRASVRTRLQRQRSCASSRPWLWRVKEYGINVNSIPPGHGKLQVDGLGGSYGVERLSWCRMLPQMGPETTIWDMRWQIILGTSRWPNSWTTSGWDAHLRPGSTTVLRSSMSLTESTGDPVMIIARSPLRITLGGGGTDLPSYYRDHEGFLVAAAIDKYVYVTVTRPFTEGIFLKYSQLEHVERVSDVKHALIREALLLQEMRTPQIEITTLADIPAGTGLGSSGSFNTALLRALHAHRRKLLLPHELAELACHIEIERLGEPVGKQDQYIAAYGGLTGFTFHSDERVTAQPLNVSVDTMFDLEDNLLLFFTGYSRSAGTILADQHVRSQQRDKDMLNNLHYVKDLGYRSKKCLEDGRTTEFGELMHEHWEHKKKRSGGMSNPKIDEWYEFGRQNGAIGGKLVGAGGGGFLMFYAEDRNGLRHAMKRAGLDEVRFRFDFEGTKVMIS